MDLRPGMQAAPADFVGVGANKSGTTWWYRLVSMHPCVHSDHDRPKELHHFDRFWSEVFTDADAYNARFVRPAGMLSGEWTQRYAADVWVAPLLHRAAPRSRWLVMLRDPWERYVSELASTIDRRPGTGPARLPDLALARSRYFEQLRRLRAAHPGEQILVLQYEQCRDEPEQQLHRTQRFLGLEPWTPPVEELRRPVNARVGATPELPEQLRAGFLDAVRDDLRRLVAARREHGLDLTLWPSIEQMDTDLRSGAMSQSSVQRPTVQIDVLDEANPSWDRSAHGTAISVIRRPVIDSLSTVYAMGSCFAVEIRAALRERGLDVVPRYFDIDIDLAHQRAGRLPQRDNVNHYDTFSILEEFEQAFGERRPATESDFWRIDSRSSIEAMGLDGDELFQNPFRKRVFADSAASLSTISGRIDGCIRAAVLEADVFVITLGMIEAWRDRRSGRHLCRFPGPERAEDCDFVLSDFASNLDNMRRVCSLIATHRGATPIVLTVSPVSIARTFTGRDVVVANTETKSVLRAVAGQLEREFDQVLYWPSYEIALRENVYAEDGRHISPSGVRMIIDGFLRAHFSG